MVTEASLPTIRRVLAAIDLDAPSELALIEAHETAKSFNAALGVVNVLPGGYPEQAVSPHRGTAQEADRAEDTVRADEVARLVERVAGRRRAEYELFVDRGVPHSTIVERANRFAADIVFVSTHSRQGVDRVLLGSVAGHVVRDAPCPVFVARERANGPVIAACDLEKTTQTVLAWAAIGARMTRQSILATHAIDLSVSNVMVVASAIFSGTVPVQPDAESVAALREAATGALRAELTAASVEAEPDILSGPASAMIASRAREIGASLIVVATHGRRGVARLALGSVAESVVRHAPCSVLVVR